MINITDKIKQDKNRQYRKNFVKWNMVYKRAQLESYLLFI